MKQWNAVILAGDRGPSDPVARAANVEGKAFAMLQDKTLMERVVSVLHESVYVNKIYTVGPKQGYLVKHPRIQSFLEKHAVHMVDPAAGPSASAIKGVMQSAFYPTLLVTCDLALLNANLVDEYCVKMSQVEADFVACAVDYQQIHKKIPALKKTQYHFDRQTVCFANVFSVLSASGLKAIEYWQDVEQSRKKPIELINKIDWLGVLKYKFGRLSLNQAASRLSSKVGARLEIATMSQPELAIDVDSAHDYRVIQDYLAGSY